MYKIFAYLLIVMIFTITKNTNAQELLSSDGEYFEAGGYQVAWSLGEVVTETFTSSSLILTQGQQQSNLTVNSIEEFSYQGSRFNVFPNPADETVFISCAVEDFQPNRYMFQLHDEKGTIIGENKINDQTCKIEMYGKAASTYFLTIIDMENRQKISYRIVKK